MEIAQEHIGGLTLLQMEGEFRLTRDAMALAAFAGIKNGDRVCDLGCGVGNVLIPLAARAKNLTLDGVELRESAADLCRKSLEKSGLKGTIVTGDLRMRHEALPWGRYDLVVANPPYFRSGSGAVSPAQGRADARTEESYTLEAGCRAAERLCKFGGRFAVCLRPERLAELFGVLSQTKLEAKRLQFIQSRVDAPPSLALVEARKGGRPGLQVYPIQIEK